MHVLYIIRGAVEVRYHPGLCRRGHGYAHSRVEVRHTPRVMQGGGHGYAHSRVEVRYTPRVRARARVSDADVDSKWG